MITTAYTGSNADLFPHILAMHVPDGSHVADVTWGKGVFWQSVDTSKYELFATDIMTGTDFRRLPYESRSLDALLLDPPYMHGGATVKKSINDCYKNENTSHASVVRLYAGGILEAARTLKKGGVIIVKCQDEMESSRQRWSHIELIQMLEMFGFTVVDLFVLVQESFPALREETQKHARKNHSYALVAKFKG